METIYQEYLASLTPDEVAFIVSNLPQKEVDDTATCFAETPSDDEDESRRRRHIEREWPELATKLSAEYYGQTYTAQIIPAKKKLKSGKQIVLLDGPAQGMTCDSFSEAMITATDKQRTDQNLARKGVSNGWLFWQWDGKPAETAEDKQAEDDV